MIRTISVCGHCKAEVLCSDNGDGNLTFDFVNKIIVYHCYKCHKDNIINFGTVEDLLRQRSRFPPISSF